MQASGGTAGAGPRRSARFAGQQTPPNYGNTKRPKQESAQSSRQPAGGAAQDQQQRSWLQTVTWIVWAVLGLLVAVMAATNPSRAKFVESIRQLTSRGLGQWAGQPKHLCVPLALTSTTIQNSKTDCDTADLVCECRWCLTVLLDTSYTHL